MAGIKDQIRGLIVSEAKRRPSEVRINNDGRPNQRDLCRLLHVSPSTMTRIFSGKLVRKDGVEKPKRSEYEPSPELLDGLMYWLNLTTREDVWAAIHAADPIPPFPVQGNKQ